MAVRSVLQFSGWHVVVACNARGYHYSCAGPQSGTVTFVVCSSETLWSMLLSIPRVRMRPTCPRRRSKLKWRLVSASLSNQRSVSVVTSPLLQLEWCEKYPFACHHALLNVVRELI
eukprot:scpid82415/ scgid9677/ 